MAAVISPSTMLCLVCCLLLVISTRGTEAASGSDEEKLIKLIENSTHPLVRPVQFTNQTVKVRVYLLLRDFSLDEKTETLEANVWNYQTWKDKNIKWDREEYSKIWYVPIPYDRIWHPTIVLLNRRENVNRQGRTAFVVRNGRIWYFTKARYTAACSMDLSYFPYDVQRCYMNFTSLLYNSKEVNYIPSRYIYTWWKRERAHNHWDLVSSRVNRVTVDAHNAKEKGTGATNTVAMVEMVFRRIPEYFVFVYIAPAVIISLLTIICFILPPGNIQKMTLGCCLLVCYCLLFLEVNVVLPTFHANVPLINKYYMTMYCLLALSIIFNSITTNLTKRSAGTCHPPDLFKEIVIEYLGKCVFLPYNPVEYRRKIEVGIANINLETTTPATIATTTTSATTTAGAKETSEQKEVEVISDWLHISAIFDRILLVFYMAATIIITSAILKNRPTV